MGIIKVSCDDCEKELFFSKREAYPNYDGQWFCKKCNIKRQMEDLDNKISKIEENINELIKNKNSLALTFSNLLEEYEKC